MNHHLRTIALIVAVAALAVLAVLGVKSMVQGSIHVADQKAVAASSPHHHRHHHHHAARPATPAPAPVSTPAAAPRAPVASPNYGHYQNGNPQLLTNCGTGTYGTTVYANADTSCEFAMNVQADYAASDGISSFTSYSPVTGQAYTMTPSVLQGTVSVYGGTGALVQFSL
jgi:hypothetical protein